jgi:uncharacterized membrane protein
MDKFANLDRIDFAILSLLQNNARLTNKEMAAAIDLSLTMGGLTGRIMNVAGIDMGNRKRISSPGYQSVVMGNNLTSTHHEPGDTKR